MTSPARSAHTPGPWLVFYDVPDIAPRLCFTEAAVEAETKAANDATDGNVGTREIPVSQCRAAPDLLSELHRCANLLSAVAGDIEDGFELSTLRGKYVSALVDARDDARAAIRKATEGGQP